MNPSLRCLALIALLPVTGQAATIFRCDSAGVPTYQDTPCAQPAASAREVAKQPTEASPKARLLQERRARLLQRRRSLAARVLELASGSDDETIATLSAGADYPQRAQLQRQQWGDQARIVQARQRLAEMDDNLRLLDARIARLPSP